MNNINKASFDDLASVKKINSLLKLDISGFYWNSDKYIKSAISEERCYVIKDDNMVKGSIIIEKRGHGNEYKRECLAIGTLAICREFRKEGFGARLVEFARSFAFKEKKRLYVESFFEYNALKYYKKLGFREDVPGDYKGKPYHILYFDPRSIPDFPEMKRISIGDRLEYLSYLQKMPVVPSDVTFENLFVFDSPSRQISLSLMNGNVIVLTKRDGKLSLCPIIGSNRLDESILDCLDWLSQKIEDGKFTLFPLSIIDGINSETRDRLHIVKDRDNFDYLYDPEILFYFKGPVLRTQRQNLTRFLEKEPEYKNITPAMIKEVLKFQNSWMNDYMARLNKKDKIMPDIILKENTAIKKALTYHQSLDLKLGGIFLDGILHGFSIAEIYNETAYIHFEKASRKKGAYQALIHLFGRMALQIYINIVNREQDLGIPGLRAIKKRHNPMGYIEKCNITLR